MQAIKTTPEAPVSFKRSCAKCRHLNVCTIVRAISPLLQNWEEGHRPFEATDAAAICREYLSVDGVEAFANL